MAKAKAAEPADRLEVRYVPLGQVVLWDENPKKHDEGGIAESIRRHGFRDAPIFDATLGALVAGNGRSKVVANMKEVGVPRPRGILEDPATGDWLLPVQFGVDAPSAAAARSFAVDHNNLTLLGGDLGVFDAAKIWDEDAYADLLKGLEADGQLPVSVPADDLRLLLDGLQFAPSTVGGPDGGEVDSTKLTVRVKVRDATQYEEIAAAVKRLVAEAGYAADVVA